MFETKVDNILNSHAQCLVNTVNCEGFMGKGIAYQFKKQFPNNNKEYVSACKMGRVTIGRILFFDEIDAKKVIANFPTKNKWRESSQYSYIKSGLIDLKRGVIERGIKSIAIPPLGCGNGGLDWSIVKGLIKDVLKDLRMDILLYEPSNIFVPASEKVPKMSASHLILMELKSGMSKFDSIRLQKAAYFLNIFSNTDYFKFEEYKFGPYAHSIEILSNQIKLFQNMYNTDTAGAKKIIYDRIISKKVEETIEKYKPYVLQVTAFVNSIPSNHELEIVATVVSIIKSHPQLDDNGIIDYFLHKWPKYDSSRFTACEIKHSIDRLLKSGIIKRELIGYSISNNVKGNSAMMSVYVL